MNTTSSISMFAISKYTNWLLNVTLSTRERAMVTLFAFMQVLNVTFIRRRYETGDDILLRILADGTLNQTQGPDSFLFYTTNFYGYILKYLYTVNASIFWYDWIFYVLITLSMITVSALIYTDDEYKNFIFSVVISTFYSIAYSLFQFTIVSGLCSMTAVLIVINAAVEDRKLKIYEYAVLLFFIFFGTSIRIQLPVLMTLLAFLPLLYISWHHGLKSCIRNGLHLLAVFVLTVGVTFLAYQDVAQHPAQQETLDRNSAHIIVYDYNVHGMHRSIFPWKAIEARIPDFTEKLNAIGWTRGDYYQLFSGGAWDKSVFSAEKYRQLANITSGISTFEWKNLFKVTGVIDDYRNELVYFFACLLLVAGIFASKRNILFASIAALSFVLCFYSVYVLYKPSPYRVWVNAVFFVIFSTLIYIKNSNISELCVRLPSLYSHKRRVIFPRYVCCAFVLCLLLVYTMIGNFIKIYHHANASVKCTNKYIDNFKRLDKNAVYFLDIFSIEYSMLPFKKGIYGEAKIILNHFEVFPANYALLAQYGITTRDPWETILKNDKIRFINVKGGGYDNFFFCRLVAAVKKRSQDRYGIQAFPRLEQDTGHLQAYSFGEFTPEEQIKVKELKRLNLYYAIEALEET